jgi:23S rRNA (uracil1939-C5)-methyltransferase
MDDTTQSQAKAAIVADCFQRLGKLDVSEILTGPDPELVLGYRNRIRVFASPAGFYGMMRRGTHDVVPLESCALMPEQFNRDILPWLRFLPPVEQVIVRLDGQGNWLLSIFGSPTRLKVMKKILSATPDGEAPAPGCVGLLYNNLPLWGRDHLVYEVAGHKYRVSAQSFFQGNLAAIEDTVATVRTWLTEIQAAGRLGGLLGDFFCGVGLFSLALQDMFTRVVAVDSDKSSCRDAENNIQRDEHARGTIVLKQGAMDLVVTDPTLADAEAWATGVCIVDPPRAGLGKEGVKALLALRPAHIVSLSCDPATLARDTTALVAAGYVLRKLKVMDFFPQTAHIECLLLLERQD